MAWTHDQRDDRKQSKIAPIVFMLLLIVTAVVAVWILNSDGDEPVVDQQVQIPAATASEPVTLEPEEEPIPSFDAAQLDATLNTWVQEQSGTPAVTLMDAEGEVLASNLGSREFFTASIYKLYVAYEGYRILDVVEEDPDAIYINGNTRRECLDLMIRESDSPCAEKMWVELGKENLNTLLAGYGLKNTNMVNLVTSSDDAAIMLARIARGEGINEEAQAALLQSMQDQIYRDALNKGFSDDVIVQNKIGFRELVEYHDTAIVRFDDGRVLVVSVLTENVGTSNIADLGARLEQTVTSTQ